MVSNQRRQLCATRRKRLVHDRRKKIVERRHVFYNLTLEAQSFFK